MTRSGAPKGPFWKFFVVDTLVVLGALILAFLAYFSEFRDQNLRVYETLIVPIIILRTLVLYMFSMYNFSRPKYSFDIIYYCGGAMLLSALIENATIFYLGTYYQEYQISRNILLLNFVFSWAGHSMWRILYLKRRLRWAYDRTRLLIVGAGELGESVQRDIREYARLGHEVVGLVDDDIESPANGSPIMGRMSDLHELVDRNQIDEIIVTSQKANRQELLQIISTCQATGRKVRLLPELYEVTIGQVDVEQVGGVPLITVNSQRFNDWGLLVKRMTDISVSALGLILLLLILPFVAAAIRMNSEGPVFYRQERVGWRGKKFVLYKFRTMYQDAETNTGPVLSWQKDHRVTAVGRTLRKWHIDEMPQLFNVLKGDMSLVGPRPERPHFARQFEAEIPAYRLREAIRPGMTGLAQIHGFYNSPVEHKLRYDLAYMNNMSFLLDMKILFLTLRATLTGHGVIT